MIDDCPASDAALALVQRCLARALGMLRSTLAILALCTAPASAWAAWTCVSQAGWQPISVWAAVSGGTSISPLEAETVPFFRCDSSNTGERSNSLQACARYASLNDPAGGYAFTLVRMDGRTQPGSLTNRLIFTPLDGQGNEVTSTTTMNSMLPSQMFSTGIISSADMRLRFRIQAPPGVLIESGSYTGGVSFQFQLVELNGPPAGSGCTGTSIAPGSISSDLVTEPIAIHVTPLCTMTQAGTLDFGRTLSVADSDLRASAQFNVSCNNTTARFHVYIDEGQNPAAGQRRMKRSGSDDFIAYDLLDQDNIPFPTATIANPTTQGKYPQTIDVPGTPVAINGRVPQKDQNARAGSYSDRVTIHVQY